MIHDVAFRPAEGSVRAQARLRDWLVVLLLMAALILSFVDRVGLSILVDPIRVDLGLGDAQIGILQGVAFGLFFAVMGVPLGWLSDRWSRKGTVIAGIALWSLATAACGLANGFPQLLAARILVGAGEAGLAPAAYSIVRDRFPERLLGRAVSLFQVGGVIGAALALMITGAIYQHFLRGAGKAWPLIGALAPWQQTFIAIAAPGILFVVLVAFVRETRDEGSRRPNDGASALAALVEGRRLYIPLFIGMSGIIMTSYALVSWIPAVLAREYGWSPALVGARYGLVMLLASPLGLLTGGWYADHLVAGGHANGHIRAAATAALLGSPFTLSLGFVQGATGLLVLLAGLHFAVSFPMGVVPAFLQIAAPRAARAQLSATYVMVINVIGLGIGPTAVGFLSSRLGEGGLRIALAAVAGPAMTIASLILVWLAVKTRKGLGPDRT